MENYAPTLTWIDSQRDAMIHLVEEWANINSSTRNLDGLAIMQHRIEQAFDSLEGEMTIVELPPQQTIDSNGIEASSHLGKAVVIRKRPQAPLQVLLAGHMDTVYGINDPFQKVEHLGPNQMRGPGVADMKGGLVILLTALQALERSPFKHDIGWEVIINPDEEIGSPGSAPLFEAAAKRHAFGLIYEPSFADGAFVSARKGSSNLCIVVRGRPAHVGRDFAKGRSAIRALARFIDRAEDLNDPNAGVTVNVGTMKGGEANNIVPAFAMAHFNARTQTVDQMNRLNVAFEQLIAETNRTEGIEAKLYSLVSRPPKSFGPTSQQLFQAIAACSHLLGIEVTHRESGGVCDGNILAAAGLPTIDTMGAIGGEIHTPNEYLLIDSLTARAKLSALLLMTAAVEKNILFKKGAP